MVNDALGLRNVNTRIYRRERIFMKGNNIFIFFTVTEFNAIAFRYLSGIPFTLWWQVTIWLSLENRNNTSNLVSKVALHRQSDSIKEQNIGHYFMTILEVAGQWNSYLNWYFYLYAACRQFPRISERWPSLYLSISSVSGSNSWYYTISHDSSLPQNSYPTGSCGNI